MVRKKRNFSSKKSKWPGPPSNGQTDFTTGSHFSLFPRVSAKTIRLGLIFPRNLNGELRLIELKHRLWDEDEGLKKRGASTRRENVAVVQSVASSPSRVPLSLGIRPFRRALRFTVFLSQFLKRKRLMGPALSREDDTSRFAHFRSVNRKLPKQFSKLTLDVANRLNLEDPDWLI